MNEESPILQSIYYFIDSYIKEHGNGPSVRNIAENCHIAIATVAYHLNRLEARGWITREIGMARSVRTVSPAERKNPSEKFEQMFNTDAAKHSRLALPSEK